MKTIAFIFLFSMTSLSFGFSPQKIDGQKGYKFIEEKKCHLIVSFGSYGSGTPFDVEKKVKKILKRSSAIKKAFTWSWGLEGEYTYCLVLTKAEEGQELFNKLKEVIPRYTKKGYTSLKLGDEKEWKTTWLKN